jgi:predicted NAD-dependent protein-ADP-ribosyltransferase YbiA (DUF1768 family)
MGSLDYTLTLVYSVLATSFSTVRVKYPGVEIDGRSWKWNKKEQKLMKVGEIKAPKNCEAIQEAQQRRQGKKKGRRKRNVMKKLNRQTRANEQKNRIKREK